MYFRLLLPVRPSLRILQTIEKVIGLELKEVAFFRKKMMAPDLLWLHTCSQLFG